MALTTRLSLLVLRLVTGGAMLYFHAWEAAKAGYYRVWREVPWEAVERVGDAGFPQPLILACAGAAVAFLASVLLILGLLTRVAAGCLLAVLLFVGIGGMRLGETGAAEGCVLYGVCCFLLLVLGAGRFAVDGLFGGRE